MKHHAKVTDEQVITLPMAQQLKTKNSNVVPGQLFCRQCKTKLLLKTDYCIDDQNKFQSVADTDNEFTDTNTKEKAPIN